MKYKVWRDQGVTVAGQLYRHGTEIDSENLVAKVEPKEGTSPEEIKAMQEGYDAQVKAGKEQLAAAEKEGFIAAPAPEEAPAKKGKGE